MEDLAKTLKAQLYDRVASPLVFSFVCAWIIWNFRLLLIIVSGGSASEKFKQIDLLPSAIYFPDFLHIVPEWWRYWLVFGFLGPAVSAILYLWVLPWFEAIAFDWSQKKINRLKLIKLRRERDKPIGERERLSLNREVRKLEMRLDTQLEELTALSHKEMTKVVDAHTRARKVAEDALKLEEQKARGLSEELTRVKGELISGQNSLPFYEKLASKGFFIEPGARKLFEDIKSVIRYQYNAVDFVEVDGQPIPEFRRLVRQLEDAQLIVDEGGTLRLSPWGNKLVHLHHGPPRQP